MESKKVTNSTDLSNPIDLKIYRHEDGYVGYIELPEHQEISKNVETIIILDSSRSMSDSVSKFVNSILPKLFAKLDYHIKQYIYLITFESRAEFKKIRIGHLDNLEITCNGLTYMAQAVEKICEIFDALMMENVEAVRILTISDGKIDDQENTRKYGNKLAAVAERRTISINSQAVRVLNSTPESEDVTAFNSLLQLNNIQKSNLIDIKADEDDNEIANKIAKLFINDGLDKMRTLEVGEEILLKFPWDEEAFEKLSVFPGKNIFWLRDVPKTEVKIDGSPFNVQEISTEILDEQLEEKIDFLADRLKVLKIVDNEKAQREEKKIKNYENLWSKLLKKGFSESEDNGSLRPLTNGDEKVSSKAAADYEVAVVPVDYPYDCIQTKQFDHFKYYLGDEMDKLFEKGKLLPNFLNFSHHLKDGYIFFHCQGLHSLEFLKDATDSYDSIPKLKVIDRSKVPKLAVFKAFTPEGIPFQSERFLKRIPGQNLGAGIDTSAWKVFYVNGDEKGTNFCVEMDPLSASTIKRTKWLFYWLSTIEFEVKEAERKSISMMPDKMRKVGNAEIYAKKLENEDVKKSSKFPLSQPKIKKRNPK